MVTVVTVVTLPPFKLLEGLYLSSIGGTVTTVTTVTKAPGWLGRGEDWTTDALGGSPGASEDRGRGIGRPGTQKRPGGASPFQRGAFRSPLGRELP